MKVRSDEGEIGEAVRMFDLSKSEGLPQGITKLLCESERLLQVIERLCRVPDLQKAHAQFIECLRQPHLLTMLLSPSHNAPQSSQCPSVLVNSTHALQRTHTRACRPEALRGMAIHTTPIHTTPIHTTPHAPDPLQKA